MQNQQIQVSKINFAEQIKILTQAEVGKGRLQLKMVILFIMISIFSNLQINSSKLLYINPVFQCEGMPGRQTQIYGCQHPDTCRMLYPQTVTQQIHLYCDDRTNDRIMILSSSALASWFGIAFAAIISDRFGRKLCFCISMFLLNIVFVLQYTGIQTNSVPLLVCSQLLIGFSGIIIYINFLVLATRFFVKDLYELATLGWLLSGGIAQILIALLNMIFADWRAMYCLYSVGIFVCSILSFIVFYEDPIYFFDTGKYQKCKELLRQLGEQRGQSQAQINQKISKIQEYIQIKDNAIRLHVEDMNPFDWKKLIKLDLFIVIIILGLVGGCYYASNLSLDFSIQNLALSFNMNLFIVGLAGVVGYLTAIYVLKVEESRRKGLIFSSIICGIIGFMFGFKFITENSVIESICVALFKISICWISIFFVRLKVDLLPEKYQGTLVGIIEFLANFGRLLAPTLSQKSIQHQLNPVFAINIIHIVVGTLPVFFLAEKKIEVDDVKAIEKNDQ